MRASRVAKIMLGIILLVLVLVAFSCNPYKQVAADPHRTDKELSILNNICIAAFPTKPPVYIPGETKIERDTFLVEDTAKTNAIVRQILLGCNEKNPDSLISVIRGLIKPVIVKEISITVDTLRETDQYVVSLKDAEIKELRSDIDKGVNKNATLSSLVKSLIAVIVIVFLMLVSVIFLKKK